MRHGFRPMMFEPHTFCILFAFCSPLETVCENLQHAAVWTRSPASPAPPSPHVLDIWAESKHNNAVNAAAAGAVFVLNEKVGMQMKIMLFSYVPPAFMLLWLKKTDCNYESYMLDTSAAIIPDMKPKILMLILHLKASNWHQQCHALYQSFAF